MILLGAIQGRPFFSSMVNNIFLDKSKSAFLTDEEIHELNTEIKKLEVHMCTKLPKMHVIPKFRILLKYVPRFTEKYRQFGYFNEQGIESIHAVFNKDARRISIRDEGKKMKWLLQWHWVKNALHDNFGKV